MGNQIIERSDYQNIIALNFKRKQNGINSDAKKNNSGEGLPKERLIGSELNGSDDYNVTGSVF